MNPIRFAIVIFVIATGFTLESQTSITSVGSCSSPSHEIADSIYRITLTDNASLPDYKVRVANRLLNPDIRVKIVNSPDNADWIFMDEPNAENYLGMVVCRTSRLADPKAIEIRISDSSFANDVEVEMSRGLDSYDFKLFTHSNFFTIEQAAAIFAIFWNENSIK